MDILDASADFQDDWELLQSNPLSDSVPAPEPVAPFQDIQSEGGGLLEPNYFSLDARRRLAADIIDDDKSAASDNPSWIDPGSDENPTRYLHKDPGGFWSDSSSERSQDRKITDLDGRNEVEFSDNDTKEAIPEAIGEIVQENAENVGALGILPLDSGASDEVNVFPEISHVDSVGGMDLHAQPEASGEVKNEDKSAAGVGEIAEDSGNKKTGDLGKKSVLWWKMPVEILKYCVFKISPMWAVSVAAAVMGFVILGRKLYKMKKRTRGLQIKLTVDDKKISQAMSHANRLNDAFSIVRRVPMIRPSLPAVGSNATWSVASLR